MFDIVLHAKRKLTPLFLSFATVADPQIAIGMRLKVLSDEEIANRSSKIGKRLRALGGLLETVELKRDGYHVRFMHLTTEEFLLRADVQRILTANLAISTWNTNVTLLSACLMQIKSAGCSLLHDEGPMLDELRCAVKDAISYAGRAEGATGLSQTGLLDNLNETMENISSKHDRNYRLHYQHWTDPVLIGRKTLPCWRNDFMSLAVETNLTLYVQQKLQDGYKIADKPGRPLLAYAVLPRKYEIKRGFKCILNFVLKYELTSNVSMVRLLLFHGADYNAKYEGVFSNEADGVASLGCWPWQPSTWQLALAAGMHYQPTFASRDLQDIIWWETMSVLLAHGASSAVTVWGGYHESQDTKEHSALFVCLYISMMRLTCDTFLPKLVISKGGSLLAGELGELGDCARRNIHLFTTRYAFLRSFFSSLLLGPPSEPHADSDNTPPGHLYYGRDGTDQRAGDSVQSRIKRFTGFDT
jgi:hypothetical protein